MNKPEWEKVASTKTSYLEKIKIEGGWIYRNTMGLEEVYWDHSLCFVPDLPKEVIE